METYARNIERELKLNTQLNDLLDKRYIGDLLDHNLYIVYPDDALIIEHITLTTFISHNRKIFLCVNDDKITIFRSDMNISGLHTMLITLMKCIGYAPLYRTACISNFLQMESIYKQHMLESALRQLITFHNMKSIDVPR